MAGAAGGEGEGVECDLAGGGDRHQSVLEIELPALSDPPPPRPRALPRPARWTQTRSHNLQAVSGMAITLLVLFERKVRPSFLFGWVVQL